MCRETAGGSTTRRRSRIHGLMTRVVQKWALHPEKTVVARALDPCRQCRAQNFATARSAKTRRCGPAFRQFRAQGEKPASSSFDALVLANGGAGAWVREDHSFTAIYSAAPGRGSGGIKASGLATRAPGPSSGPRRRRVAADHVLRHLETATRPGRPGRTCESSCATGVSGLANRARACSWPSSRIGNGPRASAEDYVDPGVPFAQPCAPPGTWWFAGPSIVSSPRLGSTGRFVGAEARRGRLGGEARNSTYEVEPREDKSQSRRALCRGRMMTARWPSHHLLVSAAAGIAKQSWPG